MKLTIMGTAAAIIGATAVALAGPAVAATGTTYGDSTAAAPYWAQQSYEDDCGLVAVADIVGQLTGHTVSENEILTAAAHIPSGWRNGPIYTAPTGKSHDRFGVDDRDLPALFDHYGIHAELSMGDGGTDAIADLERSLAEKRGVIAFVNSETLWDQTGGDHTDSDHSVVVTAVDTAKGIVHLNDSGRPDGRDEQVPLATFVNAWSEQAMVVTGDDPSPAVA